MDERGVVSNERRKAGFLEAVRAVLWSFLGVRGRSAYERDAARLNPVHVIVVGVVAAVLLVVTLVLIARAVVG
jgi:hypothetical protein